jgi:hypothetical protein
VARAVLWVVRRALFLFGDANPRAPLIVVTAMIVGSVVAIRKGSGGIAWVFLLGGIALVITPLLPGLGSLLLLVLRTAVIWVVPGALIGALVPLLAEPAESKDVWSAIAFLAAAILVAVTVARLDTRAWLLIPIAGIAATGYFVWRTGRVEACWPIVAASVATVVGGLMFAAQGLTTFTGVLAHLYDLKNLPQRIAAMGPRSEPGVYLSRLGLATAPLLELDKSWLSRLAALADPAADLEIARRDAASLERLQSDVAGLRRSDRAWTELPATLEADFARLDDHTPLRERLTIVTGLQQRVVAFGEAVDRELAAARPLLASVQKLHSSSQSSVSRPFSMLQTPTDADRLRTDLWLKTRALDADLSAYVTMLEQLSIAKNSPTNDTSIGGRISAEAEALYTTASRWLEIGLAGSFAFWTTLGFLAGWSMFLRTSRSA